MAIDRITLEDLEVIYYPNPTSGTLYFKSEKPFELRVYDVTGRLEGEYSSPEKISISKGFKILQFVIGGITVVENISVI
jgi:hypothetical protein